MAYLAHARSPMAEFGGNNYQDRKLMPETTAGFRHGDQPPVSKDTAPSTTHRTEGRGGEPSTSDEAANEDDEEDSSTAHDDEQDDDDPEALAPSHGSGNGGRGKGKHPAIRVEPIEDIESQNDDEEETTSHGTGLIPSKHPVNHLLMKSKKRTYSDLSSTSVLFGDDSTDQESFPRRKIARRLSNMTSKPILSYKTNDHDTDVTTYEHAIESDDEDYSGVNLVPEDDDDSDMDGLEQQEERWILQEEQQATALLNDYRDARRLSLDSCASDNIFGVTAPLDDAYMAALPDFGFTQFFEPEALPASPDPAAKRKYSDSSTKRVRFDDEVQVSDSSSSESSGLDSNVFPDLFLEQDKLPPTLHQLLEMDNGDDDGDFASPTSDISFWEFGPEDALIPPAETSDNSDGDSSTDSSGYDSDIGDTTDEEDFGSQVLPRTPTQKQSILHRPASAPGSRVTSPRPFQRGRGPTGSQLPPARGVFMHSDASEAIAVTNRTTKAVTFYRPRTSAVSWNSFHGYHSSTSSTANNSPRTSIAQMNASDNELSNDVFNHGLGTDIMLTGIFGSAPGNDFFFRDANIGAPEAFFPFVSIGANGSMNIMEEEDYDDSDDFENDINIADFMDFGTDGDDTDLEQDEDETDAPTTPMTETPSMRKRSTSDAMLEHFDRGVVTAFRNNQNRYRDVASLPSDPAARASVSRPVRSGKSAEALITPLRKRSRSNRSARNPLHAASSFGNHSSPLSGVSKATSRLQHSIMGPPSSRPRGAPPRMGTFS